MTSMASGTKDSMRNISQANVLSVHLPYVPSSEQAVLMDCLQAVTKHADGIRRAAQHGATRAQALRRSLLQAAFSGKLSGRASDLDRAEGLASA